MKLHFGCGTVLREGWVNVDAWLPDVVKHEFVEDKPGVWRDGETTFILQSQPQDLSCIRAGVVEELCSCHVMEHFHPTIAYELLGEFQRVLVPGVGWMEHQTPDFDSLVAMWRQLVGNAADDASMGVLGAFDYERYLTVVNGVLCPFQFSSSYPQHKSLWNGTLALFLLTRWGFEDIEAKVVGTDLVCSATAPAGAYNTIRL